MHQVQQAANTLLTPQNQIIMKILHLLSILAFSLSANVLFGQITITKENFPVQESYIDSAIIASETNFALPSEGANQNWDYSFLTNSGRYFHKGFTTAGNNANFPNAYHKYGSNLSFQDFVFPTDVYMGLDQDGYYILGTDIPRAAFGILQLTGNPNDSLVFPKQTNVMDGRIDDLNFSITMDSEWSQTRIENTNFELTVAAYSLNKTPGSMTRHTTETKEVVGYGKLVIPTYGGSASKEMEVLLVHETKTNIDSFFLGGAPAPAALLAAFGITQGQSVTTETYEFYRANYGAPVLEITSNGTRGSLANYHLAATKGLSTSINDFENHVAQNQVYPNPVLSNQKLNIICKNPSSINQVIITDLSGKRISAITSFEIQENQVSFSIPTEIKAGVYFYIINDENGASSLGKFYLKE